MECLQVSFKFCPKCGKDLANKKEIKEMKARARSPLVSALMLTAKCEYRGTFQLEANNGVVLKTSQKVSFDDIFLAVDVAASMGGICGNLQPTFRATRGFNP